MEVQIVVGKTARLIAAVKPGLRERQRQARSEAILQAAFALIAEEGYESLTMEGLAERVGISRQTLYHHFASKEHIVLQAILSLMAQGLKAIEEIDPALPPRERLRRVTHLLIESRFQSDRAPFVRARHALAPLKSHPEYLRAFERRTAVLAQIVEAAQISGDIRRDLGSRLIVQMLLGLVANAEYETLIADGQTSSQEVVEAVTVLFFHGVQTNADDCR
jgi:AcrR family transcriptional regulator